MIVDEDLGVPLCHLMVAPGDTITQLSDYPEFWTYTERILQYDTGTDEPQVGDVLQGNGGARAELISWTVDTGTWGGNNAAGYMTVRGQVGTFVANEDLNVAGGNCAALHNSIYGVGVVSPKGYSFKGMSAKAALVSVYAQTALVAITGMRPDQSSLYGQPMAAGSSWVLRDIESIKKFKFVDYTSGSTSTVQITFYF